MAKKVPPEPEKAQPEPLRTPAEAPRSTEAVAPPRHQFSVWSVFWGVILISIGALLLLGNLGALAIDWSNVWRLWPVFVIIAGFSILASTHWVWRTLAMLVIIATLGGIIWFTIGSNTLPESAPRTQQTSVQQASGVRQARIELEADASTLDISSHATGNIVDATLNGTNQTLNKQESRSGDTQIIQLSSTVDQAWWNHVSGKTTWVVSLGEQLPLDLSIKAGASQTTADLSNLQVRSLGLNAGASTLDITFGKKEAKQTVTIDAGASTITLRLPQDSGISVTINGGLNTKNIADLHLIDENTYRSDNYDTASHTIDVTANAGAATFTIIRY